MRPEAGEAVLQATAAAPLLALRLGASYLRMKRQARRARRAFYRELVGSGLTPEEARCLADEYASAVSVRELVRALGRWSG
jgi:hypothetical protein